MSTALLRDRSFFPIGLDVFRRYRLLQHAKSLSDQAVCAAWLENPY